MKLWKKIILINFLFLETLYGFSQQGDSILKKGEFKVAPLINYNSTLGVGFGLVPMYSFFINKNDQVSPKSVIGAAGFYATNKSKAFLIFGNLFLAQDKWRIQYALGRSIYNFQTYYDPPVGDGIFLDYGTKTNFALIDFRREISRKLYLGLGYSHQNSITDFNGTLPETRSKLNIIRMELLNDMRNNVNYPTTGHLALLQLNYLPTWAGNEQLSNVIIGNYNRYIGMKTDRDVLALRFHGKAGLGHVAFQQQPVLGGVDLRGYSKGKYRGDGVFDLQSEYRWNFKNKLALSAVGFAGMGTIYGSDNASFNWKLYPSIGTGIRYTALKSSHINVGLDIGFGKDDWGLYFRFNEAF